MEQEELIEQLADKEHASWSRWMAYLFSKCEATSLGSLIIPSGYVAALRKQIDASYEQLSEQERQYDREEVAHILPIIEAYKGGTSKDVTIDRGFFEHLLNCMCNQKLLPTSDTPMSDREKEMQRIIDAAYHQARDLLSSSQGEVSTNPLLSRPPNPNLDITRKG